MFLQDLSMVIFIKCLGQGAWVTQLVKHLTLGFGSGHDLTICEFESHNGLSAVSIEPASDPLSPSLSAPPQLMCMISRINIKKINKY